MKYKNLKGIDADSINKSTQYFTNDVNLHLNNLINHLRIIALQCVCSVSEITHCIQQS